MIVFHGTNVVIEQPVIINRFKTLDFGEGFYTTENEILYEAGQLDKEGALKRLNIKKLYNQVAFCSKLVINNLNFLKSYQVEV
jgi:hypothetical protein